MEPLFKDNEKPGAVVLLPAPGLASISDFFHRAVRQHIHHNLCAEPESITKGFAICQNIDLALSGHVGFKLLFLLLRE